MDVVIKAGIVVGDAVLLSCGDSERILKVQDVDGCQIRLDGVVRSIEGDWCKVFVEAEERGRGVSTLMLTRLRSLELTERVHVWSRLRAKSIDRQRQTGSDECEFWAPL